MQLPEASFVPFLRWALGGSLPTWRKRGAVARAHKAFSGPIPLLPEVEQVWSWFPALALTCKAPVHREQEAAQTLLVPMATRDLGEKPESTAFLSKHAFGAELGFPRRVSLWRMQLPEASFVPFLRWALAGSLPRWQRMGCWGHCTQGLFRPHPPSP